MISREVIEHRYVSVYLNAETLNEQEHTKPIKFEYFLGPDDIYFKSPEGVSGKPLLGVLVRFTKKGWFGRKKEVVEYHPLNSLTIGTNMLAAVVADAREHEKK